MVPLYLMVGGGREYKYLLLSVLLFRMFQGNSSPSSRREIPRTGSANGIKRPGPVPDSDDDKSDDELVVDEVM